jgi:hypothetical protein
MLLTSANELMAEVRAVTRLGGEQCILMEPTEN